MRHREHHTHGIPIGLTVLACGLALGAASTVAVVNALFDMVR